MVQDKKNFSPGNKTTDTSKNLDNRKGQPHSADKDATRPGTMKEHNLSKDKDVHTKRDIGSRK